MIERVAVPPDLYRALIQLQTDFYATQGNVGDYWTLLAERTVAAAFCSVEGPPLLDRLQAGANAADVRALERDDEDERQGDWTR